MTLKDDLSLIQLESPVPLSDNVKIIKLTNNSKEYLPGKVLRVSGFGLTTSHQVSSTLQFTDVIAVSISECRASYGNMIPNSVICTRGYPNINSGTCNGDR